MTIWDNLCILEEIARRIESPEDFTAFRSVCSLSRSAAVETNFNSKSSRIPWLMLPATTGDLRSFFSLSKRMSRQVNLPDTNGNPCYSSNGWLLVIGKTLNCFLLHPFSNTRIDLPHINTFHPNRWHEDELHYAKYVCVEKFALSASPLVTSDYTILLLIAGDLTDLAYFIPGFKSWVKIDTFKGCCYDAIYSQGKFYAINTKGGVFVIDIKNDHTVICDQVAKLLSEHHHLYLAELAGKLLVVNRRYLLSGGGGTIGFDVFEVDLENDKWLKMRDLGSRAIFVGFNSSMVVEISEN